MPELRNHPDRARLRAKAAPHAAAWVTAVPSPALGTWLEPEFFRIVIRLWLGIPVCDGEADCPFCGRHVTDLGLHALQCTAGGSIAQRHDSLRDIFWYLCRAAGLRPEVEKPGLLPGTLYRPADLWLPRWPNQRNSLPRSNRPRRIRLRLALRDLSGAA